MCVPGPGKYLSALPRSWPGRAMEGRAIVAEKGVRGGQRCELSIPQCEMQRVWTRIAGCVDSLEFGDSSQKLWTSTAGVCRGGLGLIVWSMFTLGTFVAEEKLVANSCRRRHACTCPATTKTPQHNMYRRTGRTDDLQDAIVC